MFVKVINKICVGADQNTKKQISERVLIRFSGMAADVRVSSMPHG